LLVQETHYDPWGLELTGLGYQYGGIKVNKYLYNGKELIEDNGLQYYDYGARMYDASIGRWFVVDPMADLAPDLTPYRAFFNNPIRYIDPSGLFEDDYGIDKQGNISLIRETDDPNDRLIVLDNSGNETDKSIDVDKGVLNSKKINTVTASNNKEYTFDQFNIKGDDKGKALFEFVADNTEVEWSLTGVGAKNGTVGQNILTTSHIKDSEIGAGYLKAYGYTIRKHSHSHPYNNFPSTADRNFAESLNLKFPKATLDIYFKKGYYQYNKDG
jgi:RHS repeat-associated protein